MVRPSASLWLALPLAAAACATVTSGASQNISVLSDPPGAACIFRRDGAVLGIVNPTPGTIAVQKGAADIEIRCSKPGYLEESGRMSSRFQGATLGNVLIGGVIGLIADATSGAAHEYGTEFRVFLVPAAFESAAARDAWFDRMADEIARRTAEAKEKLARSCRGQDCADGAASAEKQQAADLAQLEEKRRAAEVAAP